jgi:sialic acid synthase SpsE
MTLASAQPCLVIAEAGVNHDGDVGRACELVRAAAACGADAVKFQSFRADQLVTRAAPRATYQRRAGEDAGQHALLRTLELDVAAHERLFRLAEDEGIEFLSTPYDPESADLLHALGVTRFKLPSGELTHTAFVTYVASLGRPLLLSTGMADLEEVAEALAAASSAGNEAVTLLHCTSSYPADPASANLRAIETLRDHFGLPVGYSDHTEGSATACAAVALGACVVEKHFTLDRSGPGPDHRASMEPAEFAALVEDLRSVERALGSGEKRPTASEQEARQLARRGLWTTRDLPAGRVLGPEDVVALRPATGLPASALASVVGRRLRSDVRGEQPLREEQLA